VGDCVTVPSADSGDFAFDASVGATLAIRLPVLEPLFVSFGDNRVVGRSIAHPAISADSVKRFAKAV
jgi:hypothetical protein